MNSLQQGLRAESESEKRAAIRPRAGYEPMRSNHLSVMRMDRADMAPTITMVSGLLFASLSGVLWYQGSLIASNLAEIDRQNAALSKLNAKAGRDVHGRQQRTFSGAAERGRP